MNFDGRIIFSLPATRVVKWIAKIAIAKKHNFANNTIQFFGCRSQSQHNLIFKKVAITKVAKIIILKKHF